MEFAKYHGLGNDYLVLDPARGAARLTPDMVRRICDRHFGVGADGIVWGPFPIVPVGAPLAIADPATTAGPAVRIWNPDGSEAEKSGNGLRIFARYLRDTGRVGETPFRVLTVGGPVECVVGDRGRTVRVDMGRVRFDSSRIPVTGPQRDVIDEEMTVRGRRLRFSAATVGNPHCVVLVDTARAEDARTLGPVIETDERFPQRTNVQFLEIVDDRNLRIEIWERGAGYTLASGSSASACAAVARRLGQCGPQVTVHMPGGSLDIRISDDYRVRMRGPVTAVARGIIVPEAFERPATAASDA
ncbi:MAG: diaminopimelate epimerase [Kiritimatiellaeota bacterium]|nr:diaminopimelate epimerase [Kiritimatiellota bacterium]